jgi:hypothetical protein
MGRSPLGELNRSKLTCQAVSSFGGIVTFILATALMSTTALIASAQDDGPTFSQDDLDFFESKIRPIFVERCHECHGKGEVEGDLQLTSRSAVLNGGGTGPAIEPHHPESSLLIEAINYQGAYEMPPDSKLAQAEINLLTEWVKRGAPWPEESTTNSTKSNEVFDLSTRRAEHWCWQPIRRPEIPETGSNPWPSDDIDRFILQGWKNVGIEGVAPADRATLLRRVYFDLIGLPPSVKDLHEFLNDDSSDAFSKVVDRLLASPQFGERWARHWMDLTRYAETYGHEFDYPIADAFEYRDYLIRAFNADVPYDQFIREHIAGDLLKNPRKHPKEKFDESMIGTGFWFFGEATHGPVDAKGDEAGRIDNQIDVMSKTFLGVTVACARCHDHKFDAISAKDYYAISGFLQSSRQQRGMLDPGEKIAQLATHSSELSHQANQLFHQWSKHISAGNQQQASRYFESAVRFLRANPVPVIAKGVIIQGESMQITPPPNGELKVQEIKSNKNFAWQDDKQIWWMDGKPGDIAELTFNVETDGDLDLFAVLTKAGDYGIAQLLLDGLEISEPIDCFANTLSVTDPIPLKAQRLTAGEHKLGIKIVGSNVAAAKRHMVGLDYLELRLQKPDNQSELWTAALEKHAAEQGLNFETLHKLILAINAADRPTSPVHVLQRMAKQDALPEENRISQLREELKALFDRSKTKTESTTLFEDFSDGTNGWFVTGQAFETGVVDQPQISFDATVMSPGVVGSRSKGAQYQGVLRSPTFEIKHGQIHYRARGNGAKARLIIDGYELDVHNALLFGEITIDFPEHSEFGWITQSGDIKNYIGHRAFIEIIDQGSGFVELDEVRFSNGASLENPPHDANLAATNHADSLTVLCEQLTRTIVDDQADGQVKEWFLRNQLEGIAIDLTPAKTSGYLQPNDNSNARFVSTSGNSIVEIRTQLQHKLVELQQTSSGVPSPRFCMAMTDGSPENEFVFIRGNHKTLGPEVPRRNLEALEPTGSKAFLDLEGSGRMELADSIANANNPLTSRVIVNRLWHHLFGRGIAASVDNFGVLGSTPTHPELLDYLATEFVRDQWSMKRMIRRLVLTQTYQMSSAPNPGSLEKDPSNQLFHVHNVRRLEGEAIRDSLLAISGDLDLTMYGPSVPLHLTEFMQGRGRPGQSGPLDGNRRRSVYLEVRRNFLHPMMLAFDTPIPFNAMGARNVSNVPAQALILMNDPFVLEQADRWTKRLLKIDQPTADRIKEMFLSVIGRQPTEAELQSCLAFIDQHTKTAVAGIEPAAVAETAWRDLCHILFNMKDFVFLY